MPLWSINTIVALLSFVIAAAFGKALIPFLHKLKFGQPIKMKFGPEWHAKKQGTPTMGGILHSLHNGCGRRWLWTVSGLLHKCGSIRCGTAGLEPWSTDVQLCDFCNSVRSDWLH